MNKYLDGLKPCKREKALTTRQGRANIRYALQHPNDTTVGTPQFRHWARNRFHLLTGPAAAAAAATTASASTNGNGNGNGNGNDDNGSKNDDGKKDKKDKKEKKDKDDDEGEDG